MAYSNGNSYSGAPLRDIPDLTEPWFVRVLLAPIQDRGTTSSQ